MTDELPEFSTKPDEFELVQEPERHEILVRLHQNDWNMLKLMLKRDELSFQKFVSMCSRSYLDADPDLLRCIKRYRTLAMIPEHEQRKGVFSNRERAEIYAELEKESKE